MVRGQMGYTFFSVFCFFSAAGSISLLSKKGKIPSSIILPSEPNGQGGRIMMELALSGLFGQHLGLPLLATFRWARTFSSSLAAWELY